MGNTFPGATHWQGAAGDSKKGKIIRDFALDIHSVSLSDIHWRGLIEPR